MEINDNFIGGLFEGEGSFSISLVERFAKQRPFLSISAMARIGMKEYNKDMLIQMRDYLNLGKIYLSNSGQENGVVSWQTTNYRELESFINRIKDKLYHKKYQAEIMLKAIDIYFKKYEDKGNRIKKRSEEDIMQIIKHSLEMNSLVSVNAKRRLNIKGMDYWSKYVKNLLDFRDENLPNKGGMPPKYTDDEILRKLYPIIESSYDYISHRSIKALAAYRFGSFEIAISKAKELKLKEALPNG
jgi:hypothetical protein